MRQSTQAAPPNSVVFVHAGRDDITPLAIWGAQVSATNSCVTIGCMPEVDGHTEIVLGDAVAVDPGRPPEFECVLRTPDRRVLVTTVDNQQLLSMPAPAMLVVVKIWRSHPLWPERVAIGIERPEDPALAKRMLLPTERATRTSIRLAAATFRLFACDAAVPRSIRDFNPWLLADFLPTGLLFDIGRTSELTVLTAVPRHWTMAPELDCLLATASGELWIFPDNEKVLLKCETAMRTRLRAWRAGPDAAGSLSLVLSEP